MGRRWIRFLVGLALIPFCLGALAGLWEVLRQFAQWDGRLGAFVLGFASYLFLEYLFSKPMRTYVFGHELSHALAGWMLGRRVSRFKVGENSGSVFIEKPNAFITLAPYVFPLYTLLVIVVYHALRWARPLPPVSGYVFLWAVGLTLCFHGSLTWHALIQKQSDVTKTGTLFSLVAILMGNVGFAALLLALLFPENVSLKNFAVTTVKQGVRLYVSFGKGILEVIRYARTPA